MPVLSLQKIALEKLSIKDICSAPFHIRGVVTRVLVEYLDDVNEMDVFRMVLMQHEKHICRMNTFSVWHGISIGPRKFRNKTKCKCNCQGSGKVCECDCGALFKMLIEYRESEVFRGYIPMQKKHKKARRFIPKRTNIKDVTRMQFHDPHPFQRR